VGSALFVSLDADDVVYQDAGVLPGGETSITVTCYHAVGADPANPNTGTAGAPNPDYTPFETFTLGPPALGRPGPPRPDRGHRDG
jgi:hypothetical protein